MKKNYFLYVTLGFFFLGVFFVLFNLSVGRTVFFGKAQVEGAVSAEACRVFASPVISQAGGNNRVRVTVFVIDETGRGVSGKPVQISCKDATLCQGSGIIISSIQPNSDTVGQAFFEVGSQAVGNFELVASVNGVSIPQTVTVAFR